MKPHRVRHICRSSNPFSPTTALWQHFVLPCHRLHQQRLLSTATKPVPSSAPDANIETTATATSTLEHVPQNEGDQQATVRPLIRKVTEPEHKNSKELKQRAPAPGKEHNLSQWKSRQSIQELRDYQGVIVAPKPAPGRVSVDRLPWCVRSSPGQALSGVDRLVLEIAKFHHYATPSTTEALARKKLIEQVIADVRKVLPNQVLEVFGSERTGLALATSDIDLRLMSPQEPSNDTGNMPPTTAERKKLIKVLQKLLDKFRKNMAYALPKIHHARYPLLSLLDRSTGLDVQIVLSNDSSISRSYVQRYIQEYPYLSQVYSVVRTVFDARGLSDVFRGGFGSYSLFMMIVASLKHMPNERDDAAGALQNFLRFWANFDTTAKGVSIEPPILFDKGEVLVMPHKAKVQLQTNVRQPLPPFMLCLRDPADETNDLGRKSPSIKHVQATFRNLHQKLQKDLAANDTASLLRPLVGATYELNNSHRQRIVKAGQAVKDSIALAAKTMRGEEMAATQKKPIVDQEQLDHLESAADIYEELLTAVLGEPTGESSKAEGLDRPQHPRPGTHHKKDPVPSHNLDRT